MNIKPLIATIIILTLVAAATGVFFITKTPQAELSPKELENCNNLQKNDQGINLVFFSKRETAEEYMTYFIESSPFNKQKEAFNFFFIDDYIPSCEYYNKDVLYCNNKENVKKAASCPNDYIIIFEEHPPEIRSSSHMNVMSINTNHRKEVFLHEFGHAIASLAEEYIDDSATIPKSAKNCQKKCEEFKPYTDCFKGCTKSTLVRSIANGVMRTLSNKEYGKFNEGLLLKRINEELKEKSLITGKAIEGNSKECANQEYYLMKLTLAGEEVSTVSIETGCAGNPGIGDTLYTLSDDKNTILQKNSFNNELIFTSLPGAKKEFKTLENQDPTYFKIPKTDDNEKITITDFYGEVLSSTELQIKNRPQLLSQNG